MSVLWQIVLVTAAVGLLGLAAAVFLLLGRVWPRSVLRSFFAFATGTLLGAGLFVLLPEALEEGDDPQRIAAGIALGILLFLVVERFVHPRHPVDPASPLGGATYLVVIGDTIHNMMDGAVIAIALLADWRIGLATGVAVVAHEIPQEIADFSVLLYAGWNRLLVLGVNVVTALAAVLGGLTVYWLGERAEALLPDAVAVVAGGFLYIALSHLLPEVRREVSLRAVWQFALLLAGMGLMWLLLRLGFAA